MCDMATSERIVVGVDEKAGPYLRLKAGQEDAVRRLLYDHDIAHLVHREGNDLGRQKGEVIVPFDLKIEPQRIQDVLDSDE
jgi:hypothetical protein